MKKILITYLGQLSWRYKIKEYCEYYEDAMQVIFSRYVISVWQCAKIA